MRCAVGSRLRDTAGASIVIALVFFLICGVIGSVVVTAASVEAKSVQTHKDLQQDEYTMQSAAELVARQLGGEDQVASQRSVDIKVSYSGGKAIADVSEVVSALGLRFWTEERAETVLALPAGATHVVGNPKPIVINPPSGNADLKPVYGRVTVDADLNLSVELSLDQAFSPDSPYNMTVSIQCTPTFNTAGQLTEFWYGDNTVIEKTSGGAS